MKVIKPFRQGEATVVMTEDGENHKLSETSTMTVTELYYYYNYNHYHYYYYYYY